MEWIFFKNTDMNVTTGTGKCLFSDSCIIVSRNTYLNGFIYVLPLCRAFPWSTNVLSLFLISQTTINRSFDIKLNTNRQILNGSSSKRCFIFFSPTRALGALRHYNIWKMLTILFVHYAMISMFNSLQCCAYTTLSIEQMRSTKITLSNDSSF